MTTSVFVNLFASPHWHTFNLRLVDTILLPELSLVIFGATTPELLGDLFPIGRASQRSVESVPSKKGALSSEFISIPMMRNQIHAFR